MQRSGRRSLLLALVASAPALVASGQPSFVFTTNATDLTSDGNTTISTILDANVNFLVMTYTRGTGFAQLGTAVPSLNGGLRISDDLPRSATAGFYNGLFGAYFDLATFGNYNYGGTLAGHFMAYRYAPGTNTWVNCGGWPVNTGGAGKGSAKCDSTINTPYDISSNGRFLVGGGDWGTYGSVSCTVRGFVYDNNTATIRILPYVGTGCQAYCQAYRVATNGLAVLGADTHTGPSDPAGITGPVSPVCNAVTLAVWERSVDTADFASTGQTILDAFGSGNSGVMTRSGAVVAATLSTGSAQYVYQDFTKDGDLVRYVKSGGVWTRTDLGRVLNSTNWMKPTAISDDGNTIVGLYGVTGFGGSSGAFIWRPTINSGVPMDLQTYLATINGGNPFPAAGAGVFTLGAAISADGNAILGSMTLPGPASCAAGTGAGATSPGGVLYLNGVPCDPPRIAGGPWDVVQTEYTPFGITGNVWVGGSFPMTLQWQKETPTGSNNWTNISDSCGVFSADNSWTYEGTNSIQLSVNMLADAGVRDGRYRVIATNSCGTATSRAAYLSAVSGACCYVPSGASSVVCAIDAPGHCTGDVALGFFGGAYLGDNTTCTANSCNAAEGACCYGSGGPNAACTVDIASHCTLATASGGYGGSFAGSGTTCSPAACLSQSASCCYSPDDVSNAICTVELQSYCALARISGGLSGTAGTGAACAPAACSAVTGACCFAPYTTYDSNSLEVTSTNSVICSIQTSSHCTNQLSKPSQPGYVPGLAGAFAGAGVTCTPSSACAAVAGACCYTLDDTSDSVCTIQLQANCTSSLSSWGLGGAYGGAGSTCTSYSCAVATGACCHTPAGQTCPVCTVTPSTRCTAATNIGGLGGTYAGNASACTPANCAAAQLGSCCTGGICYIDCANDCTVTLGGVFQSGGIPCGPSSCQPPGTCCNGSTCQANVLPANCTGAHTLFVSTTTACNAPGNRKTPCCEADYNQSGGITVQDIFDFLSGWFAKNPNANITGNGAGAPTVQSIFDFLSAWFAKGC